MNVVNEIKDIDIGNAVVFEVKEVSNIMDDMEYPGIRICFELEMMDEAERREALEDAGLDPDDFDSF